ncbi:hypothetical protein ACQ86G_15715 [Roseateles chitinivorans]|uniref:hypothetical protein n=1 Tax=Roseateles chitinivorans TaxID=2917965 RepID=UPI003D6742E9
MPLRLHALQHDLQVALLQHRPAAEQAMQHQADADDVLLRRLAHGATRGGVEVDVRRHDLLRDLQAQHADVVGAVDDDVGELDVAVGVTRLVREGQTLERLRGPAGGVQRQRRRTAGDAFFQRLAERAVVGDVGPGIDATGLDDVGQVRVMDAGGAVDRLQPVQHRRLAVGLLARHHQEHLLAALRVEDDPQHRAQALVQQRAQLEAAETLHRGGGGCCGVVRHERCAAPDGAGPRTFCSLDWTENPESSPEELRGILRSVL